MLRIDDDEDVDHYLEKNYWRETFEDKWMMVVEVVVLHLMVAYSHPYHSSLVVDVDVDL